MRLARLLGWRGRRLVALPLAVWLGLSAAAVGGVAVLEHANHEGLVQRFERRQALVGGFVSAYVGNLVERQRRQADALLSGADIDQEDFDRVVAGLGFPAAALLDGRGDVMRVFPGGSVPAGRDLTGRYPHLESAVRTGRPTISTVLPSVAGGISVINFAVPYTAATGLRVFAVSIEVSNSPLSAYLSASVSPGDALLTLFDRAGAVVAMNHRGEPARAGDDGPGRFRRDGAWWRHSTTPVSGTPWMLSSSISEQHLYAPVAATELGIRLAVGAAAVIGLLVVGAVGRVRRTSRELQRANSQMTDFVAMLGHDVRQPLSTVVLHAESLLEEWAELDENEKQLSVRRISAGGQRADVLLGEVLTLAQLDAGAVVARPERVDVARVVREVVDAFGFDTGYPVTVTAEPDAIALADPAFLRLILGNLIGNAVKYGNPPLLITVTGSPAEVIVQVTDHGEGVPAAFVPHLFDRFARADSGVALTKTGTGLGLYLVRQLAVASGLAVGYVPHQPRGATFVLTLPSVAVPKTHHPAWRRPLRSGK
ncbi:ATP-binding protein [Actinoplanes sp. NPDC023714]|uniref:sensor histidine kinase n=1 Tax=Actinoplanes sp. NPDC023714 TaxID=3154322 RepID=UPI0033C08D11